MRLSARTRSTYYSCQPSHQRSKDIPAGHPPHVYLNERRLNDALLPFLATALFGPERTEYWRHALDAATEPERTAPAKERASEIEAEIADLERRIGRQLVNLEADDATPGLRRRVGERLAELEAAIAERRERLVALARASATEAPTLADVVYQLADSALDVAATLYNLGSETAQSAARESAEDWSAPPAGLEPATHGLGNRRSIL